METATIKEETATVVTAARNAMNMKGIASKLVTNGPKKRKRAIRLTRYRTERVQAAVQAVQEGQAAQAVQAGQAVQEVQEAPASIKEVELRTFGAPAPAIDC